MPKIKFHINYKQDLENILSRITSFDPAGLDYRVEKKGLDKQVVKNILAANNQEKQKEILDKYLKRVYNEVEPDLKNVQEKYEEIWKQKNNTFFEILTRLMGDFPWGHDEYLFLISAFYSMVSWGGTNKLAVWWKRNPQKYYFMNGYELILSHFFETIDQLYEERPVSNWHLWALAEIIAHIFTFKEEKTVSKLWPQINTLLKTNIDENFIKGSYPQLAPFAKKVYKFYRISSDYQKFAEKSLNYISKYSKEELTHSRPKGE